MTERKSPAPPQRRASRNNITNASESTVYRRQDGYAAPTADDRREAQVLAEAQRLGYRLSVPCLICGHPLTAAKSLVAHVGPVCRTKAAR